jgi:hypothetical protein
MRPYLIPLGLAASLATSAQTTGTEHWVTFMENLDLMFNGDPTFYVVISSDYNTQGEVLIPAINWGVPFTVTAGHAIELPLPQNIYYGLGDEAIFDFGLKVIADDPVSVYAYHNRVYFSEASIALPVGRLSDDYLVLAHQDDSGSDPSEFVVMATQDSTVVEITPSELTISFRPPDVPYTVTLNAGQTYQQQAHADLTGSRVRSLDASKPIAVFSGARQANVGCGLGADDHLYNQTLPVSEWGTQFIVVPFKNRGGDEFRIMSATDGNMVTVGNGTPVQVDAGQFLEVMLSAATRITASNMITVGQFNESQGCNPQPGDPCFLWNLPMQRKDHRLIWRSLNSMGTIEHYLNAVTSGSAQTPEVILDGVNISNSFSPVPTAPGNYYAQVTITEGEHVLECSAGIWATTYSFGDYNSVSYALGYEDLEIGTSVQDQAPSVASITSVIQQGDLLPVNIAPANANAVLYDHSGREVLIARSGEVIDVSPGLYVYRVIGSNGDLQRTGRLLVTAR